MHRNQDLPKYVGVKFFNFKNRLNKQDQIKNKYKFLPQNNPTLKHLNFFFIKNTIPVLPFLTQKCIKTMINLSHLLFKVERITMTKLIIDSRTAFLQ